MTWSYNSAALSVALNRVRLEIGDTDTNRQLLQDEEITQIISEESTFLNQIAKCCRLICALVSADADRFKLEEFEEDQKGIYDRYEKMAKLYEAKAGGAPWAGSIEESFKKATVLDDSLVDPMFKRNQFKNTQSL